MFLFFSKKPKPQKKFCAIMKINCEYFLIFDAMCLVGLMAALADRQAISIYISQPGSPWQAL